MHTYQPPCATWKLWIGQEVEGTTGLGKHTLFIRGNYTLTDIENMSLSVLTCVTRIWFCKEYTNWDVVRGVPKEYEVGIEATLETLPDIPLDIRVKYAIYLKIDVSLYPGDHVCIGAPFYDESFRIGQGVKVSPRDYMNDVCIIP